MSRPIKKIPDAGFFGVCAGIAYSLGIQTWMVRLLFVVLYLYFTTAIIIPYFIIALLLPEWNDTPEDYTDICE